MLKNFGKEKILSYLHQLDDNLDYPYEIRLCGTAAILLRDIDFRHTWDIDFTKRPDTAVHMAIVRLNLEGIFDERAPGVVCLLEDYEDRLVEIKDNFKYLKVYVISVVDWMVSKLEAPKFGDLLQYTHFITQERLDFIENNMHLYCGLRDDIAKNSLQMLKNELKELNK